MSQVADVKIEEIMNAQETKDAVKKIQEALEANTAVNKLMEAAQTVEDMYQAVKEYINMKLDDFKVLCDKTIEYFKSAKTELDDETLECVSGGWSLSGFWNKYKKTICAVVFVACMTIATGGVGAMGGITAAIVGGASGIGLGAGIGAAVGVTVGAIAGGALYDQVDSQGRI